MSDVTHLRTLTRKSTLKFGKYYDLTVQNVLDAKGFDGEKWLIWSYYNCSKIDYAVDILDELNIVEELRIEKPGKASKEKFKELDGMIIQIRINLNDMNFTDEERLQRFNHKSKQDHLTNEDRALSVQHKNQKSKDYLRRKNQGH